MMVRGIVAALGSAAAWAVGAILMKKVGDNLSSLAMTLVKAAVSIVLLVVPLLFLGFQRVEPATLLLFAVSGLLGIAISDTCFFEALKDLGPVPLLFLMTLGQAVTVVFAVVFLRERPSPLAWLGIALVIGGVATVLSANLTGEKKTLGLRGLVFGIVSVLSMSVSYIMIKKPLESGSAMQAALIRMVAGAAGVFLVGLATRRLGTWMNPFQDRKIAGYFLLAVIVVTYGGFWLSLAAWKYADAATANTLISTEPIFVLPLAAIFLKEKITLRAVAGTAVTVPGVVLLCLCRS